MLDFEAFIFIRVHNWDGRTREMRSGEATTRSAHENFEVLQELKKHCGKDHCSGGIELATLRFIAHDFAPSPLFVTMVRLWLLSQTEVPIIIIIIIINGIDLKSKYMRVLEITLAL